ncbi:cell fate (sporulation/competence/biofilm development) regulator YlbF (YheA/YmcA/DUF963 family) [Scopulibacillus darangshiensis]|uniref:UPF0342 protein EV207_11198 n=1 Tax=Scopulibacillus darangshiensis TaxID=442528 RepID=A0A4V2SN16_9BACL|nr:YlbF family regulator [Scopulibacillus darangshiensis]TCP29296.1 cell fate (sporulation/competence/biofilm development) regulator YlbF (YheA/YmcA/DUF963 family) [Scopulibacillus darangshiensis]
MANNLHDVAYDLEKAIRNSEEYQTLTDAYKAVNEDEMAKKMFDNFRNLQMTLQQKQMSGETITEEEAQQAQQQVQVIQQHEAISKLMASEQRMSMLINDLNNIITKPLEDLYGKPEDLM